MSEPSASRHRAAAFSVLLLLSSFCGISYEVLYGRMLSNFIGDQFAVTASILLTFMLGIGIGTLAAHRLWRWLWLIEALIGICGATFALGNTVLERWLYSGLVSGSLGGAMVVCCVLLCAPAFLIGCSLPLFAGYLKQLQAGHVFARAYAIYNLGAALTVLGTEFWLLREAGLRKTVLTMASINILVALLLRWKFHDLRSPPPPASTTSVLRTPWPAFAGLALASLASAIFQLLMVKLAESFLGPYRETFALVLTCVLAGLALGAAITRRWRISFGAWIGIGMAGLAWLVGGFAWVTGTYAAWYTSAVDQFSTILALKAGCVAALMLIPATAFGALVPALLGESGEVARDSGRLLCVSSLANAAGFLLMAFVLHQHLDYGVMLLLIAGLGALALLIQARFRPLALISAVVLMAAPLVAHFAWWNERTLYFGYHFYQSAGELRRARVLMKEMEWFKGRQDVFSLNRYGEDDLFFINGYISNSLQAPAEKMVSIFPAMFAPRTDRALVLGVGRGATAGAAALAFDHVDAVEINPVVLENLDRMEEHNFRITQRMNVRFILDDGIHHIKTNTQRYPIIINTVTSPRYFSSAKLYTRDFFESVRARLEPDGLYVAWIDGTIGNRGLDIILMTASQSFRECSVGGLTYGYFLLICSQEPIRLRHPELARRTELAGYFKRSGVTAELLPYSLLTTRAYGLIADTNVPINTLDFPALEFEMSRVGDRPVTHFTDRLERQMDLAEISNVLQPAIQFDPLRFALCSDILFEKTTLSQHTLRLAAAGNEDFQEKYRALKLAHLAATAEAARTPGMWHLYATELLAQRRYGEAIATERLALAASPERSGSWAVIGASQEKISAWPEAIQSFRSELKLDQNDGPALFGLGRVHFKMQRYDEALEFLQQSNAEEERPEIRYYLGLTLEAMGRTNEAKAEFERGLRGGGK